jgi:plastocyanin
MMRRRAKGWGRGLAAMAGVLMGSGIMAACDGGPTEGYGQPSQGSPAAPPAAGGASPAATASITVTNNVFNPTPVTVAIGGTVIWNWNSCDEYGGSGGCISHNVTFPAGANSATQSSGTFQRQFPTAGTFEYRCTLHAGMTGTVVVR